VDLAMENSRFDRLEDKLDRLTDAVTAIARVEEKMLASNHRTDALETRVIRTEKDLNDIAILARRNSGVVSFVDKAFWLVAGAIAAIVVFIINGGIAA